VLTRITVLGAEDEADLLAFELLAPARSVLTSWTSERRRRELLQTDYGLPSWAADLWSRYLDARRPQSDFMSQLRRIARKS